MGSQPLLATPACERAQGETLALFERLERDLHELKAELLAQNSRPNSQTGRRKASQIWKVLRARRTRAHHFGGDLFAEPGWDMLLEAYACSLTKRKISVTGLCASAGVPGTTALRWLHKLEDRGFITRYDDPLDARRSWVELSEHGIATMAAYMGSMKEWALT